MPALSLSEQDLLSIAATASSIDERLGGSFLPDDVQVNDKTVDARLNAWCQAVAKGDWRRLQERLSYDGLNLEMVRRVLGAVRLREDMPGPAWLDTLSDVLRLAALGDETGGSQTNKHDFPFLDSEEPLPFEEVLTPFILVARQKLIIQSGAAYHLLGDKAHRALERNLLQYLTTYAVHALYLEFSIELAQVRSPLERLLVQVYDDNNRTVYRRFVERMQRGGLATFFKEYTVLARLLATITDLWVEANAEFLRRLSSDWSEIQRLFDGGGALGQVETVQTALSDPHRGRRSVIGLTFASGQKLIYKPKDLGAEEAFNHLLSWFNQRGAPLPFKVLKVIDRSTHGWVEFVEHEPCRHKTEAQHYYRRAGMLLCLVYVLEGTDCHYENIIACGEHPVLVDMETLMHHRPRFEEMEDGAQAEFLAYQQMAESVLRTGLLPNWQVYDQRAYDVSGLGTISEQEFPALDGKWEHINTDRMVLAYGSVKAPLQANQPMLEGIPLRLEEHAEDVIEGFRQMYCFLRDQCQALLAPESPLHELACQRVRFVYRPTRVYGAMFKHLLNPTYLRNGADRSISLELLGRAVLPLEGPLRDAEKSCWWPVFAAERQAMEQMDTPFFTTRASSDMLIVAPGQEIAGCLQEASSDLVIVRLKALSDEELEWQVGFIAGSLYTYAARDMVRTQIVSRTEADACLDTTTMAALHGLVANARAIAEQIATRAIRAGDGSAAWIVPQYLMQAERYQLQPAGHDLYSGAPGIALFLAALEKITGAGYRELALGALQPLSRALRYYGPRTARDIGIGGASGLGSVVYTLVQISQLLDEPALLEDARRAAQLITADYIAEDSALDIVAGSAGAILGLLALYRASPDQEILERAVTCGRHLLQARTTSESGYRAWQTIGGKLFTGFSHGAAGIAYALLRLYEATHNREFLEAAQEGIIYEDSVFSPEANNWPDFRMIEQPAFTATWCYGAPGIGLARIGGLPTLDTDQVRADIEAALQTTQQLSAVGPDYLCCGTLGRAEVMLVAAHRLARPELAKVARSRAWQVVARAEQTGSFLLHPLLPGRLYNPSFFQGMAGIGYALLRMAHPSKLPSVLLWE
jgi:type 2 lantibiotic biosynthesis protein LanM